jgi:hypothetical protein
MSQDVRGDVLDFFDVTGGVGCRDQREVEGTCRERPNKLQLFPLYATLSNRARGSVWIELFSALLSYSTMSATDVSDRPRTYRPKDIADATGRHPESIRRNLRDGDIEGHKMGGEWVVTPDALQKWLGDDLFEIYFGIEEEA